LLRGFAWLHGRIAILLSHFTRIVRFVKPHFNVASRYGCRRQIPPTPSCPAACTSHLQVRSLTRDVGALREALRQEEKKRERLAAHAKGCEEAAAGAQAQVKQLTYVNSKLEQELHTVRERAEASSAKSRGGLEAVRLRLAEVEGSVHQRSVQAHRHVQRMHSLVQDLQAAVMPLAVAAAAGQPPHAAALKSPFPGRGSSREGGAQQAWQPEQLHRHFSSVFGGLTQLATLFSGSSPGEQGNAAALLLTAPDGSTKSVRWQDQSCCGNPAGSHSGACPAGSAGASSRGDGCHGAAGSAAAAAAAAAGTGADQQDRERLAREVQRLRAALAEARQRLTSAEAASSNIGAGGGRVDAAMRQLEAVVPQYRAAASTLQGQVNVLKEKLAAAEREHAALQEEASGEVARERWVEGLGGWGMQAGGGRREAAAAVLCVSKPFMLPLHPCCCRYPSGEVWPRLTRQPTQRRPPGFTRKRHSPWQPTRMFRCAAK
jgi:predicted  nucleic acid-binding Zn-ribbon protein